MDPALLRNIALQTNDQGESDAQIALVARRMIDRNGQVQLNPDDLPATMRALGGAGAVPMWQKFSVTAADISRGTVDGGGLIIPLLTTAALTVITGVVAAPVESLVQDPEADPQLVGFTTMSVGVGYSVGGGGIVGLLTVAGYGEGPQIVGDPSYVEETHAFTLFKQETLVAATMALPSQDEINPPVLADYQKIITGAFNLWLLLSKLP
jgi:hypothetical protein